MQKWPSLRCNPDSANCECFGAAPPSVLVIQLILEWWSKPEIPSKNELGNCNTVKNREIVILLILALNYQKKVFDYVSKSYFF